MSISPLFRWPNSVNHFSRIYKLLLLMLPGKGVTKKQPPLPDSKEAEWSLQDLLFYNVWPCSKTGQVLLSCEVF
ncbi:hypothetical protein EWT56_10680 [Escherichia coli O25b:H4]|nr:hypothetical protein EWT56_10680 [Escherichia coli O25b:H4]